jgi:hypothetical protein
MMALIGLISEDSPPRSDVTKYRLRVDLNQTRSVATPASVHQHDDSEFDRDKQIGLINFAPILTRHDTGAYNQPQCVLQNIVIQLSSANLGFMPIRFESCKRHEDVYVATAWLQSLASFMHRSSNTPSYLWVRMRKTIGKKILPSMDQQY